MLPLIPMAIAGVSGLVLGAGGATVYYRSKIINLEFENRKAEAEVVRLKKSCAELKLEIDGLKLKIKASDKACEDMKLELHAKEAELANMIRENAQLQGQVAAWAHVAQSFIDVRNKPGHKESSQEDVVNMLAKLQQSQEDVGNKLVRLQQLQQRADGAIRNSGINTSAKVTQTFGTPDSHQDSAPA